MGWQPGGAVRFINWLKHLPTDYVMALHKIKKGLNLPITGAPEQRIEQAVQPRHVALIADDYVGMKPAIYVSVGDDVQRGQPLFEDKKTPGVRYTSPASGKVAAINRGHRRALQSVVIQLDTAELTGHASSASFDSYSGKHPGSLTRQEVKDLLLESGLWTSLRGRPFDRVASPVDTPHSIFVTAIDTNPLAPSPDKVLEDTKADFARGLEVVAKLTAGVVYVCAVGNSTVRVPESSQFRLEHFSGPHPAGTVGLHIHWLDPVDRNKTVWHLYYQDVIAIGRLFNTGELSVERVISLAGPTVRRPRLLKTRLGVATSDIVARELSGGKNRVISGSVLSGRTASDDTFGYLGRFHHQISVVSEDHRREFLGWLTPGLGRFSTTNTFVSRLILRRKFDFTTTTNGSDRAMVPIGMYEKVMPFDILPTFLLRSLLVADAEKAEELGCLELAEEDLALCSFVCPGKVEYGPLLSQILALIEKEG